MNNFKTLIALLIFVFSIQTAFAVDSPKYKDPSTAVEWATYIPGAGHMYAGEKFKGGMLLLTSVGASVGGFLYSMSTADSGEYSSLIPSLGAAAIVFGIYVYSLYDADKAAERTNAKNGLGYRITPNVSKDTGGMRYGVNVSLLPSKLKF